MRKNVMLSLLAVTSASMGAYAEANLTLIKNSATTDWLTQSGNSLQLTDGAIVSAGADVYQNIDLYPGKYTLSVKTTSGNVNITANSVQSKGAKTVDFEVTGTTKQSVKIVLSCTDNTPASFSAGGFTLTLNYSFSKAATGLAFDLSEVINTINVNAVKGSDLSDRASAIGAKIKAIPDDSKTAVVQDALDYDKYYGADDYKLYLGYINELSGYKNSPIESEIAKLKADVADANNNTAAYNNAITAITGMNVTLKNAKDALDAYTYSYKKEAFTDTYTSIAKAISDFKETVEAANTGSKAVEVCTVVAIKAKQDEVSSAVKVLVKNISDARDNTVAYVSVADQITKKRALYSKTLQDLITLLPGDPDVYANMLTEAQGKLKKDLVLITNAETTNGTVDAHDAAAANQKTNEDNLTAAETDINSIWVNYNTLATQLKADYKKATGDVAALTNSLNGIKIDGSDGKFKDNDLIGAYDNIKTQIADLNNLILANNKAYKISELITGTDYANKKAIISKAITDFSNAAAPKVANYDANLNSLKAIQSLQDLLNKDNQTITDTYTSANKTTYVAINRWKATADKLQADINAYTKAAKDASGSNAVSYYDSNKNAFATTTKAIGTYLDNAKSGFDYYTTIATDIAKYEAEYTKLVATTSANTAVTVGGNPTSTDTYQSELDSYRSKIDKINNDLSAAIKKNDDAHLTALKTLNDVVTASTIITNIDVLIGSYSSDKSTYDGKVQTTAAATMVSQATERVNTMVGTNDTGGELATYTKKYIKDYLGTDAITNAITSTLSQIIIDVKAERTKINTANGKVTSDAKGAIAILNEVNSDLDAIRTRITAMEASATIANNAVVANNDAKTKADNVYNPIYDNLYGSNTNNIISLEDYYGDPSSDLKSSFVTNTITPLKTRLTAQLTAINNAYSNLTLVTAWADTKDAQGKVTAKGIKSLLEVISKDVDAARATAETATANYKEKEKQLTAYNGAGFQTLLDAASDSLYNKAKNDDVKKYYNGLISTYTTQKTTISDNIDTNYKNVKSTSYTGVYSDIETLKDNINAIINGVVPNETSYALQSAALDDAQKTWTLVYDSISVRDQSYASKDVLAKLAVQQTNITNLKTTLYGYYITGQSKTKDADVTLAIATINTTVAQISTDQKNSYESNILADNKIRYERFVSALTNADNTYTAAIKEISKFNDIKNSDLRAELNSVIEANTSIYQYASKILNEKTTVGAEFTAVQKEKGKEIFDIDETYTTEAVGFQTEIETALKDFTDNVNQKAKGIFLSSYNSAVSKEEFAVGQIKGKYDDTVTTGSFASLTNLKDKATLALTNTEFAIQLDGFIDEFSSTNIDALIAEGYKIAAAAEYKFLFDPIDQQYQKDLQTLAGYEYQNSTYTSDLNKSYKINITNGAKKTATDAGNDLYKKLPDVTASIGSYCSDATGLLVGAKNYNTNNVNNKNAYDRMLGYIKIAQTALDQVKTSVSSYYYVADKLDYDISSAQSIIDSYTKEASGYNLATTAVDNESTIKDGCTGVNNTVSGIINTANVIYEIPALTNATDILKKEYNTAAAKFGIDNETIKIFNSDIDSYVSELSDILSKIKTSDPTVVQSRLLALEGKIAAELTKIVNFYDAFADNAVAKAIATVKSNITDLTGVYKKDVDYLGTCDKTRVQDVYSLGDIDTAISAIEAKYNTYNTTSINTVLFYSKNLLNDITTISGKLESRMVAIKAVQVPIDANQTAYTRIIGVLDGYNNTLTALVKKIKAYESTVNNSYAEAINGINNNITKARGQATTDYKNGYGSLNADSPVPYNDAISSGISDLDKTAANNEAIYQIGVLTTSLSSAHSVYGNNKYTASDDFSLQTSNTNITNAINNISNYRDDAFIDGSISKDINGNVLNKPQSIDFVTAAIDAINAKIKDIKKDIASYTDAVNNNSYILGDVKRDGSVLVNDYTELLKLAGDPSQVDVTSPTFYAADINLDKKINIGDVTAVANIIKNGSTTPPKAKAMFRVAPVAVGTDALSLSAEGEGTTQRIAINLNNSTAYVAGQMDIKLPAGMTLLGESLSSRANGHSIYATDLSDGTHRVIISTVENNEFNNSESAILYLDVNITSSKASDKISVSNIMFTDASARIYNLADITSNETTGINSVSSESIGSKIYSVGGKLMNALQKGVNIIRNTDGTTKKIIKK